MPGKVVDHGYYGPWSIRTSTDVTPGAVEIRRQYEIMLFHPDTHRALSVTGDGLVDVIDDVVKGTADGVCFLPTAHPLYEQGRRQIAPDDLRSLEADIAALLSDAATQRPEDVAVRLVTARERHAALRQQMDVLQSLLGDVEAIVTS